MSLDALRGFDMFWIVGADTLVEALRKLSDNRVIARVADQLDHVKWAGFHFEDLIFPMFVFIVGVSAVFSLDRTIEREGRRGAVLRIVRRAALLYAIGVLYYGGFNGSYEHIRLLGVLQRIARSLFVRRADLLLLRLARAAGLVHRALGRLLGAHDVCAFPGRGGR